MTTVHVFCECKRPSDDCNSETVRQALLDGVIIRSYYHVNILKFLRTSVNLSTTGCKSHSLIRLKVS
jgi:hypothetical protein